jgi:cysteine desulfurase / selenocysteine lyase
VTTRFDPARVRGDVPELRRTIHGQEMAYLDSAASSLPPRSVIEVMTRYYERTHTNVHRGVYEIAEEATEAYEHARRAVGAFIGAPDPAHEVVFTKNATESFNLFARSWGAATLGEGDVVVLTEMEHHANLVPWLQLREERGIELRYLGVTDAYRLDLSSLDETLAGAKLLSVTGMSNVLGTVPPLRQLADAAHAAGAIMAIDAAQLVGHAPMDVQALGIDVACFSAHKMLGPTGIGVLWARRELLEGMPPFLGGGGMILDVRLDGFRPAEVPHRFEAGTPPIAEAVGLAAAVRYLEGLSMEAVQSHDLELTGYALERLGSRFGDKVRVFSPSDLTDRGGVLSIELAGVHAHDLAQVLDRHGVCVRPGHHCAKPLMRRLGVPATARVSFGPYSLEQDVDALLDGIDHAHGMFG